ncbi:MAG: hypothetical protein M1833_000717 [Piccolia ochrophora]|nr:MAG: hypothetical protein M1833_000717 [Piccolia ochrophora]
MVSPSQSPKRRPLHERSQSQTNELGAHSQTIRIVTDSQIYASGPYPTQPSQVLSPSAVVGGSRSRGDHDVSDCSPTSISPTKSEISPVNPTRPRINAAAPSPSPTTQPRTGDDDTSEPSPTLADPALHNDRSGPAQARGKGKQRDQSNPLQPASASVEADSPGLFPSRRPPGAVGVSPTLQDYTSRSSGDRQASDDWKDEINAAHNLPVSGPELQQSSGIADSDEDRIMPRKHSADSGKGHGRADGARRPSATYSAFPPSGPPPRTPPPPPPSRHNSRIVGQLKPILKKPTSARNSTIGHGPASEYRQTIPVTAFTRESTAEGPTIRYPIIRAPTSRESWANSTLSDSGVGMDGKPRPHPLRENAVQASTPAPRSGQVPHHGGQMGSISSSMEAKAPSSSSPEPTLPSPVRSQHLSMSATIRRVSSIEETGQLSDGGHRVSILDPSSFESRLDPKMEQRRSLNPKGSFRADGFPTWTKRYYGQLGEPRETTPSRQISARGVTRHTMPSPPHRRGSPGSSTDEVNESGLSSSPGNDNLPLGLYRPRNRPHTINIPDRQARIVTPNSDDDDDGDTSRGGPRARLTEVWSPRLRPDRRTVRMSVWSAPPVQEKVTDGIFTRRRMQIFLFCCGFLLPFAWMTGALLPLPMNPLSEEKRSVSNAGLEEALAINVRSADEARYYNARWWRNVNRIMSAVGVVIIAAIVTLVVLALRMQSNPSRRQAPGA